MTDCEYCGKPIHPQADFVRLDEECIRRVHVTCFVQKLFPEAKPEEIKVKRVASKNSKQTEVKS